MFKQVALFVLSTLVLFTINFSAFGADTKPDGAYTIYYFHPSIDAKSILQNNEGAFFVSMKDNAIYLAGTPQTHENKFMNLGLVKSVYVNGNEKVIKEYITYKPQESSTNYLQLFFSFLVPDIEQE